MNDVITGFGTYLIVDILLVGRSSRKCRLHFRHARRRPEDAVGLNGTFEGGGAAARGIGGDALRSPCQRVLREGGGWFHQRRRQRGYLQGVDR